MRHIAFGFGEHYCLGAPLARLEAKITFSKALQRFSDLSLTSEPAVWRPDIANRGPCSLPMTFEVG
ncbi:cytochrome P450 [Sulfidibacter corallicola]|uniref:cytochrome P450 n=1 Tax=Sulfidibacter corallicola TaxID=2818388 RepID=UPI002351D6D6|nr:cytochrome P450 [Sulfidibacter corallicola]